MGQSVRTDRHAAGTHLAQLSGVDAAGSADPISHDEESAGEAAFDENGPDTGVVGDVAVVEREGYGAGSRRLLDGAHGIVEAGHALHVQSELGDWQGIPALRAWHIGNLIFLPVKTVINQNWNPVLHAFMHLSARRHTGIIAQALPACGIVTRTRAGRP